ncbi:uncharacterized protein LOC143686933 [Tamandua tetradactyla]|uniref:uncharacterized protein LOC143686933 n=1 Tax=Tamandua tetradactyla TaxID=48850 RepID=UPI004053EDD7
MPRSTPEARWGGSPAWWTPSCLFPGVSWLRHSLELWVAPPSLLISPLHCLRPERENEPLHLLHWLTSLSGQPALLEHALPHRSGPKPSPDGHVFPTHGDVNPSHLEGGLEVAAITRTPPWAGKRCRASGQGPPPAPPDRGSVPGYSCSQQPLGTAVTSMVSQRLLRHHCISPVRNYALPEKGMDIFFLKFALGL